MPRLLPAGEKLSMETSLLCMGPDNVVADTLRIKGRADSAANPATTGTAGSGASGGTRANTTGTGNYKTIGTAVNLRSGAGTDSTVITVMSQLGSPVQLSCYLRGTSVAVRYTTRSFL